jgi:TolA-binding protein
MKNSMLLLTLFLFLLSGCAKQNNNGDNARSSQEIEDVDVKKEINALDSASKKLENTQKEIEESSKKLDEALDEL